MKALSLEQLLQLHVLVIAESGGSDGLRDLGRLQSVVASQTQSAFGEDIYPSVFEKAAALVRGIVGDHPFVDGNKRTAILAGLTLLKINGKQFVAKKGELEDFAVKVATDHLEVTVIAAWLTTHCD